MSDIHLTEDAPSSDGASSEDELEIGAGPDDAAASTDLLSDLLADLTPEEAVEVLAEQVVASQQSEAAYLDRLQRVTAEFDNFRKRSLREQQQLRELGSERVLASLLPTLDSLDAAMALPAETESEQRLLAGMAGTQSQLMEAVAREGLVPIPAMGVEFDPTVHEAISAPTNASGPLVVIAEIRRGYKLKDKVLRPSLVALGVGEEATSEETEQQEDE